MTVAYLETHSGHKLDREGTLVMEYLKTLPEVDIQLIGKNQVKRLQPTDTPLLVACGHIPFVRTALKLSGHLLPTVNDYPTELTEHYHRKIWTGTMRDVTEAMPKTFIKPRERVKLFTGFICSDPDDFRLRRAKNNEPLWFSERVRIVTEWRVYVIDGKVAYRAHYDRDFNVQPDWDVVRDCVDLLKDTQQNYAIDIGVTPEGTTLVIEVNDGFSIGAYGDIPPSIYGRLLTNRWKEMTQ